MSSLHHAARIHGKSDLLGQWSSLVSILVLIHILAFLVWIGLVRAARCLPRELSAERREGFKCRGEGVQFHH